MILALPRLPGLRQWLLLEPAGFETYEEAAAIYRDARKRGVTISTSDAVIAAIAMENDIELFTLDADFTRLALPRLRLFAADRVQ